MKKKEWCHLLTSHKCNFELPSDYTLFAYYPYRVLIRLEYWRGINVSRFKRRCKDGEGQKTKERINQGRDRRELHDDDGISENVKSRC